MAALETTLRKLLEKTVIEGREAAEGAALAAIETLAVRRAEAFPTMGEEGRGLRTALRAKAKALGDGDRERGWPQLIEEIAYEQWHRMLFARFLAENDLLLHPEAGVPVTIEECAELAASEGAADGWELAARYAGAMLPGLFRADDPAVRVRFAPEGRARLERLVAGLPAELFRADDALGWVYQFWQTKKKDEVNRSGRKIGGADLAPVTQLFTEDYMVRFLLENSLCAWWAARHPASPLLSELAYLRFRDDGSPAAGTFPGWPGRAEEITVMDPCCGSGHFLVAAFDLLRRMRMEEEGLSAAEAADAVLRDNLFGLELDPRCTQIATFAVAMAAWKVGGHPEQHPPRIACSGIAVAGQLEEWHRLAGRDENLRHALDTLYPLFKDAPTLGSLIDPKRLVESQGMFAPRWEQVEAALHRLVSDDAETSVFAHAAEETARAAVLLSKSYTLVATNVPYLQHRSQSETLRKFCIQHHSEAQADLATVMLDRCLQFCRPDGSASLVAPQNWLFLGTYSDLRHRLLVTSTWNLLARLGTGAFETITGEVVNVSLTTLTSSAPQIDGAFAYVDAVGGRGPNQKAHLLCHADVSVVGQQAQLGNPDQRISHQEFAGKSLLQKYGDSYQGISTGDYPRFVRSFWECHMPSERWSSLLSTVVFTAPFGGREQVVLWDNGDGELRQHAKEVQDRLHDADRRGAQAWGKCGVAISQMGSLPAARYSGEVFDSNVAAIIPKNPEHLPAIWAFCSSPEFNQAVRRIDTALKVTNATLVKVPFDLERWQKVADEMGPLPEPHSDDPTQWLFMGHPVGSTAPLQVAVARLLGYRWPEQGEREDGLEGQADADGIVCLPSVRGERPAAERLRALLSDAYGDEWSTAVQDRLLSDVGFGGKDLAAWLADRNGFFVQHARLFHNRPFIWQIWDGARDGFSALVNYHTLTTAMLDKLIHTYLGDWIAAQRGLAEAGEAGAEGKLAAALALRGKLTAIRAGKPPYDVYIRWKPLVQQPIGWDPDLNDGVRLNVRPFVAAEVLRAKFSVNWNKDRGTNPDGSERLNDRHPSLDERRAARAGVSV